MHHTGKRLVYIYIYINQVGLCFHVLILVIHGQLNTLVVYLELGDQTSQQLIYIIELVCCTVTHTHIYIYIYTHTISKGRSYSCCAQSPKPSWHSQKEKEKEKRLDFVFMCLYSLYMANSMS